MSQQLRQKSYGRGSYEAYSDAALVGEPAANRNAVSAPSPKQPRVAPALVLVEQHIDAQPCDGGQHQPVLQRQKQQQQAGTRIVPNT